MEKNVSRAYALYNLLMTAPNKWWSQEEIAEWVEGYVLLPRTDNDRCSKIRSDMLYINSEQEFEKLVVCRNYHFKIAEKEDVNRYYYARIRRLRNQVKQLKDLEYKMRRDGHSDILNEKWWETYWNECDI